MKWHFFFNTFGSFKKIYFHFVFTWLLVNIWKIKWIVTKLTCSKRLITKYCSKKFLWIYVGFKIPSTSGSSSGKSCPTKRTSTCSSWSFTSKSVILFPFVVIRKTFISFWNFLKFFLCIWITFICIWMVFFSQLVIWFLYIFCTGIFWYTKYLVIIFSC